MNHKSLRLLLLVVTLCALVVLYYPFGARAQQDALPSFDSPLPQPDIVPTPTPLSPAAVAAVQYLAAREQIPAEELLVVSQETLHFPTIDRTYEYVFTVHPQRGGSQEFPLLVDPETGAIEPDIEAIRQTERAAYAAKYGKLHPDLYERLAKAADDEQLPVTIWVAYTEYGRQPEELVAEVVQRYPEAAAALREYGVPWVVDDSDLANVIHSAYDERLRTSITQRVEPLAVWLEQQGLSAARDPIVPNLTVKLTKAEVQRVAAHELVEQMYLAETESSPASNIATATSRIPFVWSQGINGAGVDIAILEAGPNSTGTNINSHGCLTIAGVYDNSFPDGDHQSQVATIAACSNDALPGVAEGARIFDAGYDPDTRTFSQALYWAGVTSNADIINISMSLWPSGQPNSTSLILEDRIADYYVRHLSKTIVVAAGNTTGRGTAVNTTSVSSPGKGWNVITVGNLNDQNSVQWSAGATGTADQMSDGSSYVNPATGVEKPEVAVPGTSINTVAGEGSGTSFATPHVSGLAALLMDRNSQLINRPEVIKAILLASAANNVRDSRVMQPTNQDFRDGAGGVDAALADATASLSGGVANTSNTCDRPCWWATDSIVVTPGNAVTRVFKAARGERIRVAIAWFSQVDALYLGDNLNVNYNLEVRDPSGNLVVNSSSASLNNSQELSEFVAPATGAYTIRAVRSANDTLINESNELGIAWTKQATYTPDVRRVPAAGQHGLNSTLYVRNNGALARPVEAEFVDASGSFYGNPTNSSLDANRVWTTQQPNNPWVGAGIVDGSEDLSVAVANRRIETPHADAAYSGISWLQADSTYYIPLVMRNRPGASGVSSAEILIQNLTASSTSVTIELKGGPGYSDYTRTATVQPSGSYRYYMVNDSQTPLIPDDWIGSAKISTSGARIAVVAYQQTRDGGVAYAKTLQGHNAFPQSSATLAWGIPHFASRLPNGLSTPIVVQNLTDTTIPVNDVQLDCVAYPGKSNPVINNPVGNHVAIPPYGSYFGFNPVDDDLLHPRFNTNGEGYCTLRSNQSNNRNVAVLMQMRVVGIANNSSAAAYEALPLNGTARQLVFPVIQRKPAGDGDSTTVIVQNLSTTNSTTIRFYYYNTNGTLKDDDDCTLQPGQSFMHNHTTGEAVNCDNIAALEAGWSGSLVVVSESQAIDGFNQLKNSVTTDGDRFMAHNALR